MACCSYLSSDDSVIEVSPVIIRRLWAVWTSWLVRIARGRRSHVVGKGSVFHWSRQIGLSAEFWRQGWIWGKRLYNTHTHTTPHHTMQEHTHTQFDSKILLSDSLPYDLPQGCSGKLPGGTSTLGSVFWYPGEYSWL